METETFGQYLRRIRCERQYGVGSLAALVGTDRELLARIEEGKAVPDAELAGELQKALYLPESSVAGFKAQKTEKPLPSVAPSEPARPERPVRARR